MLLEKGVGGGLATVITKVLSCLYLNIGITLTMYVLCTMYVHVHTLLVI